MQTLLVQVSLGDKFEDLYIKAYTEQQALVKAKARVKRTASLAVFRHHFANYVLV